MCVCVLRQAGHRSSMCTWNSACWWLLGTVPFLKQWTPYLSIELIYGLETCTDIVNITRFTCVQAASTHLNIVFTSNIFEKFRVSGCLIYIVATCYCADHVIVCQAVTLYVLDWCECSLSVLVLPCWWLRLIHMNSPATSLNCIHHFNELNNMFKSMPANPANNHMITIKFADICSG